MVSIRPAPVLAVGFVVWVVWRLACWRHARPDVVRELAALALAGWALAMVSVTLFPLQIVFYDWHGRFSLVPFASTMQLLTETSPQVAARNLVGNVVMFVPFGLLLPILFARVRRPGALAARALAVSVGVEATQLLTRARAVDVDDLLLNVLGAMVGWGLWWASNRVVASTRLGPVLDRAAADDDREPLRAGAVPVAVTALLVVPWMVATVVGATVPDGPAGIEGAATGDWPAGRVVARADLGSDTFVLASDGGGQAEQLRLLGFNRVLPGRYTLEAHGEPAPMPGSGYWYGITPFNVTRGEQPMLYLWGANRVGATSVEVTGNGVEEVLLVLPDTEHFVVGTPFTPDLADVLDDFTIRFLDGEGNDVSPSVPQRT